MIIDFHFHFPAQKITESEAVSRAESQISVWYRSGRIKIEKSLGENSDRKKWGRLGCNGRCSE